MNFDIATDEPENGTCVISLTGEVDLYRVFTIHRTRDEAVRGGTAGVPA